jgi:hypothetical protein
MPAQPRARLGIVAVARILPPAQRSFPEPGAQLVTAKIEQWPDHAASAPTDSGRAARTGATHQLEQHGLRLVVFGVCGGGGGASQLLPRGLQLPVALLPPPSFPGQAPGALLQQMRYVERNAEIRAQAGAEGGVLVGAGAAGVVVDMNSENGTPERREILVQERQERDRVRATRESGQDRLAEQVGKMGAKSGDEAIRKHSRGAGEWTRTTDTGLMRPLLYL